ncbi:DNA endonuclease SmrA [Aliidiomarina soli]|uniref:DNA endonuclease SmrA n=2 Tax=Aliidiomarina soli TaxID=1928574 RepID=A0A432WCS3_9GAMM|nr:DNA endonuclease SmrA [Aliidiomarina soli]
MEVPMYDNNRSQDDSFDSLLGDDVVPLKHDTIGDIRQAFTPTLAQLERQKAAAAEAQDQPADALSEIIQHWLEPGEAISWRHDGVQDGVFRSLKRGDYTPSASLSLQQHNVTQARHALANFIHDCYQRGVRNALIIHGMSRHSQPKPGLLRSLCGQWLPQLEPVLAAHSARPEHGGLGATYVMIRKNNAAKIANKERNRRR